MVVVRSHARGSSGPRCVGGSKRCPLPRPFDAATGQAAAGRGGARLAAAARFLIRPESQRAPIWTGIPGPVREAVGREAAPAVTAIGRPPDLAYSLSAGSGGAGRP